MNTLQNKAARQLRAALIACANANLAVHALTEVGFYAIPIDVLNDRSRDIDTQMFYAEHGEQCAPIALQWDGGAGV